MTDRPIAGSLSPEEMLAQPFGLITDLVRMHAERNPQRAALVEGERAVDYAEFDATLDRVAASLQRDGVKPGDAIAICAANSIEYALAFFGGLRAGAAVAPIPSLDIAGSLARMVADAQATHLFCDAAAAKTLGAMREAIGACCIALDGSDAGRPFRSWLAEAQTTAASADIGPDSAFNIIYSSGTTGVPKGIVQPHRMRWVQLQRGPMFGHGPQTVTLLSTPLHSNTTLVSFFPTLALGGTVVLMPKFDAAGYLALAERHRVTHTMLVPVQYSRIMALPDFARYDLSSFRIKFCTSAPFAAALKTEVLRRWPGGLVEYYGMTEGGGTCILVAHEHPSKLHTVGRPAPGHDIRVIDEAGRELPRGAIGEIVGRSGAMMTCYHRQPARTAEAEWFDSEGRRYMRTGDIGRFDDDGFLTLLDRRKDMIISGGFNVYPSDLEAILLDHPDVAEVAVVGVPSEQWGESPVAFVVPRSGARVEPAALLAWANSRLSKVQRLVALELKDDLPRGAIGKVLKRELRESFRTATRN